MNQSMYQIPSLRSQMMRLPGGMQASKCAVGTEKTPDCESLIRVLYLLALALGGEGLEIPLTAFVEDLRAFHLDSTLALR